MCLIYSYVARWKDTKLSATYVLFPGVSIATGNKERTSLSTGFASIGVMDRSQHRLPLNVSSSSMLQALSYLYTQRTCSATDTGDLRDGSAGCNIPSTENEHLAPCGMHHRVMYFCHEHEKCLANFIQVSGAVSAGDTNWYFTV